MFDSLKGYILIIDQKTWYIIIAVLAIILVISLVKKAVKFAMFICMLIALSFGGSYVRTNIMDANNIRIENKTLYIMDKDIELEQIAGMDVRKIGESQAEVIIKLKDGSSAVVKLPNARTDVLKAVGSALNIDVSEKKVQ